MFRYTCPARARPHQARADLATAQLFGKAESTSRTIEELCDDRHRAHRRTCQRI